MAFAIDFFDQDKLLGGTEVETSAAQALSFAELGLFRHDALWARVRDQNSGKDSLICVRARGAIT